MIPTIRKTLACTLIVTLPLVCTPISLAHAGMVGTDAAAARADGAQAERQRIATFLAREDVRAALGARGLDAAQASDRVQALSDEEAVRLAGRLDQAPAGGDGIIGVLFAVFIILLITDILGLTKVFPFTRPMHH